MAAYIEIDKCLCAGCDGAHHRWDYEPPTLKESLRIVEVAGLEPYEWAQAMGSAAFTASQARALVGLLDMVHRRAGTKLRVEDIDALPARVRIVEEDADIPEPEGKDPTTSPLPDSPGGTASGNEAEEDSAPRSPRTPVTSGAATG